MNGAPTGGRCARLFALAGLVSACNTAGSAWMAEPLPGSNYDEPLPETRERDRTADASAFARRDARAASERRVLVLGDGAPPSSPAESSNAVPTGNGSAAGVESAPIDAAGDQGRSLGTFRNTYYDFPNERDFEGSTVALKGRRCETLKQVPRTFHDAVCVQGSGRLTTGATVSFSRRSCECAETCPRTGERICFDQLDADRFPFGRGATGRAITPLYSVAVDSDLIPLGTTIYVPELRGLPKGTGEHDGCLLAEDRGIRVKGKQVDVFTGDPRMTALYNRLLPSNRGVTVVVGSSRCGGRRPGSAR